MDMTDKKSKGYTKSKIDVYKLYMETQRTKNAVVEYVKEYGIWDKLPVSDNQQTP